MDATKGYREAGVIASASAMLGDGAVHSQKDWAHMVLDLTAEVFALRSEIEQLRGIRALGEVH